MGKIQAFQQMVLEQLDIHEQKCEPSKWFMDLNVKNKTMKLLEKVTGESIEILANTS